jgi:hypothetical protein
MDTAPAHARHWRLLTPVRVGVALSVAGALTVGGVALAAIPDTGTGVFHGCVNKQTGLLRVIDPSKGGSCTPAEMPIQWNQAGPPGLGGGETAYASADQGYSFTISSGSRAIPALQASVHTVNGVLDITESYGPGGQPVSCGPNGSLGTLGVTVVVDNDPSIAVHSTANVTIISNTAPSTVELVTDHLLDGVHTVQVETTDPGNLTAAPTSCQVAGLLKVQAVTGATVTHSP